MADFSSRLPVEHLGSTVVTNAVGSVAITSQAVWTGVGSVLVTGSVNLGAAMAAWTGVGSALVTGSVNLGAAMLAWTGVGSTLVTGSVNIGGNPASWTGVGSVLVTGSVNLADAAINAQFTQEVNSVADYNTSAALAAAGSAIHWYKPTGSFYCMAVKGSFSGKGKVIVGTGSPTSTNKVTSFNSTAHPDCDIVFPDTMGLFVGSNTLLQVIRFNREAVDAQDVYTTIFGVNNP